LKNQGVIVIATFGAMRYLLVFLFMFIVHSSASAQIGFGVELGAGFSGIKFAPSTYPIDYTSASTSAIFGGKIGALVDVPLSKHIYFQTGLYVSRKGGARTFSYYANDSFNESVNQTLNIYYGEAPVSIIYKTGMQGKGRVILGIGATPAYIIGGRDQLKDQGAYQGVSINSDGNYKIVSGTTIHGFDIGVNLIAGYELPTGLFFRLYYTAGVNDIGIGSEFDKNRIWGIAAGYIWGKGRNINKEADDLIDKTQP